jgi:hypothetical protein
MSGEERSTRAAAVLSDGCCGASPSWYNDRSALPPALLLLSLRTLSCRPSSSLNVHALTVVLVCAVLPQVCARALPVEPDLQVSSRFGY